MLYLVFAGRRMLEREVKVSFPVRRSMNRLPARYCLAALLALLLVVPSWGQKSGSHAPSPAPAPSGGSVPNAPGQPMGPSQPSGPQMQTPLYVNGRILMDTGQPVPEPVSVGLNCGMNSVQVIRTDLKGD